MDILNLFRVCRNVAKLSTHPKYQVGAEIVKNGNIYSLGCNKNQTHPDTEYGVHAERSAIIHSGKDHLKNSIMITYRETNEGKPAMSRPCNVCMKLIEDYGCKRIYYSIPEFPYWKTEKI